MADLNQGGALAAERPTPYPVRMDRSRDHSTIHMSERVATDPHAKVFYYQDGLPYGSDYILIHDHQEILADPRKQAKVEQLQKQAAKRAKENPGDEFDGEAEEEAINPKDVNLSDWAMGKAKYPWQAVTNAIARRYAKRVTNKTDALELMLTEKAISLNELSAENKKLMDD